MAGMLHCQSSHTYGGKWLKVLNVLEVNAFSWREKCREDGFILDIFVIRVSKAGDD